MKKIFQIICMFLLVNVIDSFACAHAAVKTLTSNWVVDSGTRVDMDAVYVDESLEIENNGVLDSDIYVCDRCSLYVKNTGVINSRFYLGNKAKIIHVISDVTNLKKVNFGSDYTVLVESENAIAGRDVMDVAAGANKIVLRNSVLDLSGENYAVMPDVELQGVVKLIVDNIDSSKDVLLLRNVSGAGTVVVADADSNPMFSRTLYYNGADLYLASNRETDYKDILGPQEGDLLDDLNGTNSDNPLFDKIESAQNKEELNKVLNKSALFNQDIVFDMLRIVNMLDATSVYSGNNTSFGLVSYGVLSEDFYLYGIGLNLSGALNDNLNVNLGLRIAKMDYKDSFNDFSGDLYGANITLNYLADSGMFVRAMMSANMTNVGIDTVVYDGDVINKPRVFSGFVVSDVGYKFILNDSFYIAPFVGAYADLYKVENTKETNLFTRIGFGAGYNFDALGIHYDYNARFVVNGTDGFGINLQVGAWSEMDAIGADVNLTAAYVVDVLSYGAMANIKLLF